MSSRRSQRPSGGTALGLLGDALLALLALLGGVAIGGWLAFETAQWEGFKAFVEGLPVLSALHLGLLSLALGLGAKVALRRVTAH